MYEKRWKTLKCPEEIMEIMNDFFDDDLEEGKEQKLREHLRGCHECQTIFNELKKTIAFVRSTSTVKAPDHFTERIMASLPKEKKKVSLQRWLTNHPFISAASLFMVLMMGSFLSTWSENREFSVSKQSNLVVKNHTVIVPKGQVVKGDVVVQNGKLKIEGEVEGNVTVINGEKYLASAGHVTGSIEEVNEVYDWIWYYMKKTGKDIFHLLSGTKE
jgi:anti-sigma factor RsiW